MTTTASTAGAMPEIAEHEPAIAPSKAKRLYLILGGAVLLLLIGYGIFALLSSGKEATDDAQVSADIVPVAARVAGQVTNVYITENQPVHAGQVLADLDPSDAQVKVAQAELLSSISFWKRSDLECGLRNESGKTPCAYSRFKSKNSHFF